MRAFISTCLDDFLRKERLKRQKSVSSFSIGENEPFLGGFAPPATWRTTAVFSMVLDLFFPKHCVHKDTARYVSSYSKPFKLLLKEQTNCPPKSGNFTDNNFNLSK